MDEWNAQVLSLEWFDLEHLKRRDLTRCTTTSRLSATATRLMQQRWGIAAAAAAAGAAVAVAAVALATKATPRQQEQEQEQEQEQQPSQQPPTSRGNSGSSDDKDESDVATPAAAVEAAAAAPTKEDAGARPEPDTESPEEVVRPTAEDDSTIATISGAKKDGGGGGGGSSSGIGELVCPGLGNRGNLCFLNAILQCLAALPAVVSYLQDLSPHPASGNSPATATTTLDGDGGCSASHPIAAALLDVLWALEASDDDATLTTASLKKGGTVKVEEQRSGGCGPIRRRGDGQNGSSGGESSGCNGSSSPSQDTCRAVWWTRAVSDSSSPRRQRRP